MNRVNHGGKGEFAEDGESRARAAERLSFGDVTVERVLHRSVLPEAHVVGLVAAGDKDSFRLAQDRQQFRITRVLAIGENDCRHRIQRASRRNFSVHLFRVVVLGVCAQNQEVAAGAAFAKKTEGRVLARASSHKRESGLRLSAAVLRRAGSEVFPRGPSAGQRIARRRAFRTEWKSRFAFILCRLPVIRPSRSSGAKPRGRARGFVVLYTNGIGGWIYQILQACSRTMASPFLHPNAFANSAMLESGPLTRNCGSGWGLVLAISRAYSSRSLAPHTWAQPRKKRCSGVNPSRSGGRGFPSSDFS